MPNNLDIQYQNLLKTIIDNGIKKADRTGTGTKSIFGYQIRHKMSDGFPLLTTKKLHFKAIVTELVWFLRGDTNIKFLVDNDCNIWNGDAYKNYKLTMIEGGGVPLSPEGFLNEIKINSDFAIKFGELGPIYGMQWRDWRYVAWDDKHRQRPDSVHNHIDQIANLINDLKNNPDSRRLMVSAWNVGEVPQMVLPPCHYGFQLYTRDATLNERVAFACKNQIFGPLGFLIGAFDTEETLHKLCDTHHLPKKIISLMWNQRSVDTFLGLPYNIASYGLLLEILAKEVNMIPDELIGNLGDTHLYLNHLHQAEIQMTRDSFNLPEVDIVEVLGLKDNKNILRNLKVSDFTLNNYESHPHIKAQLSN